MATPNPITAANQAARIAMRNLQQQTAANRIAARAARQQAIYIHNHPNAPGGSNVNADGTFNSTPVYQQPATNTAGQFGITPATVQPGNGAPNGGGDISTIGGGGVVDTGGIPSAPSAANATAASATITNKYVVIGGIGLLVVVIVFLTKRK